MTKIDFHTNVSDKIAYTCRLVRKALATSANSRIVVLTAGPAQLASLDETLWTFSDTDFLPHAVASEPLAQKSPIILTDSDIADLPHHHILVNLSSAVPTCFAQFERMIEVVSTDSDDVEAGRQRFGHYRQRGYTLTHSAAKKA